MLIRTETGRRPWLHAAALLTAATLLLLAGGHGQDVSVGSRLRGEVTLGAGAMATADVLSAVSAQTGVRIVAELPVEDRPIEVATGALTGLKLMQQVAASTATDVAEINGLVVLSPAAQNLSIPDSAALLLISLGADSRRAVTVEDWLDVRRLSEPQQQLAISGFGRFRPSWEDWIRMKAVRQVALGLVLDPYVDIAEGLPPRRLFLRERWRYGQFAKFAPGSSVQSLSAVGRRTIIIPKVARNDLAEVMSLGSTAPPPSRLPFERPPDTGRPGSGAVPPCDMIAFGPVLRVRQWVAEQQAKGLGKQTPGEPFLLRADITSVRYLLEPDEIMSDAELANITMVKAAVTAYLVWGIVQDNSLIAPSEVLVVRQSDPLKRMLHVRLGGTKLAVTRLERAEFTVQAQVLGEAQTVGEARYVKVGDWSLPESPVIMPVPDLPNGRPVPPLVVDAMPWPQPTSQ